ncbi:MAG TPA: helix-turn-helix domain-containing protein [Candidatus Limnocylindrales bacterium]
MADPVAASAQWLSLGPASRLVGVDPDTLRRWADEGRIEAYITPGGHRRFDRVSIEMMVATRRSGTRPLASLGASPERLNRAYRRSYTPGDAARQVPADDQDARERYRRDGRLLVEALISHLDADRADAVERMRSEADAVVLVDDLARRLAASGISLTEAVAMFVAARRPFLDALTGLGRRRALEATRLAALYDDASGLLDRLLLRLIGTFQETVRAG